MHDSIRNKHFSKNPVVFVCRSKSVKAQLKLSAACCGESSILKEQYRSSFARYRIQQIINSKVRMNRMNHL